MNILLSFLLCCTTQAEEKPTAKSFPIEIVQKSDLNTVLSSFKGDEFISKGLRKKVFSKALDD